MKGYSVRHTTLSKDRLSAMAGLIGYYQGVIGDMYTLLRNMEEVSAQGPFIYGGIAHEQKTKPIANRQETPIHKW